MNRFVAKSVVRMCDKKVPNIDEALTHLTISVHSFFLLPLSSHVGMCIFTYLLSYFQLWVHPCCGCSAYTWFKVPHTSRPKVSELH